MPPARTISKQPNPHRGTQETRPCVQCGQPVTRYLSPLTIDRPWACSKRCNMLVRSQGAVLAGVWKRPEKPRRGDTIPCAVCGTPFYRVQSSIDRDRRLCSRACVHASLARTPTIKPCAHCGAEMSLKPSQSHRQFCSQRCAADHKIVRPSGRIHNGRPVRINAFGYVMIWEPSHPNQGMKGWQLEHRFLVEQALGRYLTSDEQVDHVNQDKTDNRLENLQVLDASSHSIKTNAENLGALKVLKAHIAAYEAKYGPLME
jgi:endogenous inhibitor of DNA gyrase (YacG/DUF329 family)